MLSIRSSIRKEKYKIQLFISLKRPIINSSFEIILLINSCLYTLSAFVVVAYTQVRNLWLHQTESILWCLLSACISMQKKITGTAGRKHANKRAAWRGSAGTRATWMGSQGLWKESLPPGGEPESILLISDRSIRLASAKSNAKNEWAGTKSIKSAPTCFRVEEKRKQQAAGFTWQTISCLGNL